MIYNGYTQAELEALLRLLEELKIPHALGADEQLMQSTTQGDKGQRRGALNASYMKLQIEDEDLKKIDPKHYAALERFHIYPQHLDVPEGLEFGEETAAKVVEKKPAKPANKFVQIIMMIILGMMVFAALKGRG